MRRHRQAALRRFIRGLKPTAFGLAFAVATFGFLAYLSAEGGNVRYSYEEVQVGGEPGYVLVPRAEGDLSGDVDGATLEQAFEKLRQRKRQTYGNSYAVVTGDDPRRASVEVHIDSNHARFAPVIMAEAVYTLTEYGVSEVEFPGFADEGMTRADISVPAYTLTVPLWKAVPPTELTSAQVLMADDELVGVQEIEQRWNQQRAAVIDDVYEFLDAGDDYTVREVVTLLPELGELRLDDVVDLLVHDSQMIRQTTLEVLEGHEDERVALQGVSTALNEESNASLSREFAEFLGRSSDEEFSVEEQFYLIEHGDDDEASEAVRRLSQWDGDDRVVDTLEESLRDERSDVAAGAAESLDDLGMHTQRIEALEDDGVDPEVRLQVAEDLADDANTEEVRIVGLAYIAEHRDAGHAAQAIRSIAELGFDEGRQRVEQFLEDDSRERRVAAIDALTARNDADSVEALMDAAADGHQPRRMRQAAYDIMVSQPLDEIIRQTRANSVRVQQVAYRAIGERASEHGGRSNAVNTIEQGTDHRDATIRGAAAESLGQIGGDDALRTLASMTDDSDADVRRNVALALGEFAGNNEADTLREYLDDDDPGVVAAAIDAMERRDDRREAERIREMVEHNAPQVRASALRAATSFLPNREEETVRQHMGLLSGAVSDDDPRVQRSALEQLGRFEDSMAVTNIASLVGASNTDLRLAAVDALADTGHEDARPLLETALGDSSAEVRSKAVEALIDLVGSEARPELEARMEEEDDPEVKEVIESHLQRI